MTEDKILKELYRLRDPEYRDFQSKLIPTVDSELFIGVRTPDLKKLAVCLHGTSEEKNFLNRLPHKYFDENQLHAFLIAQSTDFDECIEKTNAFLLFIDNWATCDQLSPKSFRSNCTVLFNYIRAWLSSGHIYTVRFGIKMLMSHFLDDEFDVRYPQMIAEIKSNEYYVNMMIAWYFATALAKQYDAVIPFIRDRRLDVWVHNKTIQKAVESFRIKPECKTYLKSLRYRK
jgi:3-methyladenine DNA glycosylase AlkD